MAMQDQVESNGQPHVGNGHANGHTNGKHAAKPRPEVQQAPVYSPPTVQPRHELISAPLLSQQLEERRLAMEERLQERQLAMEGRMLRMQNKFSRLQLGFSAIPLLVSNPNMIMRTAAEKMDDITNFVEAWENIDYRITE